MKKILIAISFFLVKTSFSQAGYDYFLAPAEEMTIPVGGKLTLHVQTMNADGNILQADPAFVGQWTINGKETADPQYGNISHGLSFVNATYTAPDKVPAKNPVDIAVRFKTRSQGNESKITLVCTITITDAKNYFFLGGDNIPKAFYEWDNTYLTPQVASKMAMGIFKEGELVINVNGNAKNKQKNTATIMGMSLMIDGKTPGTYPWKVSEGSGSSTTTALTYLNGSGEHFTYASGDCLPHKENPCQSISLQGSTTITDYNSKTGEIKGYFSGQVMTIDPGGNYIYATTYGRFSVTEQKF